MVCFVFLSGHLVNVGYFIHLREKFESGSKFLFEAGCPDNIQQPLMFLKIKNTENL